MKYECDKCGACCSQLIVEIDELDVAREPRLKRMATAFRMELEQVVHDEECLAPGWQNGGLLAAGQVRPCPALVDNQCSIYPSRPNVCVAFQAGTDQCQQARQSARLPPLLPIGKDAA